ncbi:MAG: hypothetical protein ACLQVY_21165 [Limisphaerales bacterium]
MQLEVFKEPGKDVTAVADGKSSSYPRGVKHMTARKMQILIHWPRPAEDRR